MSELRNILEESVSRLFGDQIDNEFLTATEDQGFPTELWEMVCELGLPSILLDEEQGGMGGCWADAFVVIRHCGRASLPLPVPEAILANWLCAQAGVEPPPGIPGVIPVVLSSLEDTAATYRATHDRIPWGRNADFFIGLDDGANLVIVSKDNVECENEDNLGHDPRDTVHFNDAPILTITPTRLPADTVRCLCAMMRSAQIAGAGSRCLEIGVDFVGQREQFGRTLSRFQAIQHHLAVMAGELATVEAMSAASFHAMDRLGLGTDRRDARFDIAASKCRASDAVEPLTKIGHQVHGAIGFTYEYGLHFLTRRLWSWRAELGGSGEWAEYLGRTIQTHGGDQAWALITN